MNDNVNAKAGLWADRIHSFQESGLSRKDWCRQAGIPQSTFGYWIRKIQSGVPETENASGPVFAKYPFGQDILSEIGAVNPPMTVCLP